MDVSYQCPRCSTRKPTYEKLLKHQQIYHESECGFFIVCRLEDCPRKFLSVKSLKNHIRKKHKYQKQGLESAPDCDPVIQETVEFPQSSERALSELIENFTWASYTIHWCVHPSCIFCYIILGSSLIMGHSALIGA